MTQRKLVTIRRINSLTPIEGADKIELAKIDGWQVVVEKGLHKIDDYVIYCEIDSWIPKEIAPFLSKGKEPREYNGVKGEKLKTIRLKKCLSQGLILPLSILTENQEDSIIKNFSFKDVKNYEVALDYFNIIVKDLCLQQFDIAEYLGIQKWEAPIPANLRGKIKGNFPHFVRKTDQERIQNLWEEYKEKYSDILFCVELKLDGTSFTCYYNEDKFGVCSRNFELDSYEDKEESKSKYWEIAREYNLEEKLKSYGKNLAIQGEIIGEGIQGNKEKLKGQELRIFDIYDIDNKRYLTLEERDKITLELELTCRVPYMVDNNLGLPMYKKLSDFKSLEELLEFADGPSLNSEVREGVVFKSKNYINGQVISFKVISNKFLEIYE